jgi:hypothetical protein
MDQYLHFTDGHLVVESSDPAVNTPWGNGVALSVFGSHFPQWIGPENPFADHDDLNPGRDGCLIDLTREEALELADALRTAAEEAK